MPIPEFDMWSRYLPAPFKEHVAIFASNYQNLPDHSSLALILEMTRDYLHENVQARRYLESDEEFLLLLYFYHGLAIGMNQLEESFLTACSEEIAASLRVLLQVEKYRLKSQYDKALEASNSFLFSDFHPKYTEDIKTLFLYVWFKFTRMTLLHNLNKIAEMKEEIENMMRVLEDSRLKSKNLPEGALASWTLRVEMWHVNLKLLDSNVDVNDVLMKLEQHVKDLCNRSIPLDRVTLARYHNFIAVLATRNHQLVRAKRHYELALDLSREVGYENGYRLYSMNYLHVLLDLLYYDEVFQRARELSEYWLNKGNLHYFLVARELMIKVLRIRHQKEDATRLVEETVKVIEKESITDLTLLSLFLDHAHDLPVAESTVLTFQRKFEQVCQHISPDYEEHVNFIKKELELSREFHSFNWPRALTLANELFNEAFFKKKVDVLLKVLRIRLKIHLFSYMIFASPASLKHAKKTLLLHENLSRDLQYSPGILGSVLGKILVHVLEARKEELQHELESINSFLNELKTSFNLNQSEIIQFLDFLKSIAKDTKPIHHETVASSVMHYIKILNMLSVSRSYQRLPEYKIHGVLFYSSSGSPLHAFWLDETVTEQLAEASTDLDIRQKEALLSGFLSAIKSFAKSLFGSSETTHITHGPFLVLQRQIPNYEINACLIISNASLFQGQILLDDLINELKGEMGLLTRFRRTVTTGIQDTEAISHLELKIRDFFIKRDLL